jgi:hypothetical protein
VRYVIRTALGMGLFAFCWVAIAYGIFQLLQVGTCASGGPYVSARECPDGIERLLFSLMGGIVGLFLAAFIYAGRGAPPGSDRKPENGALVVWFWTGLFWSLAVGSFLGVWGPEANPGPGGKTGGLIVGFMGLVMGAGGFLALGLGRGRRDPQKVRPVVARVANTATRFSGAAGSVDRLETLDRLRRQGTLTEGEFQTLKTKIIEEG